jgi:hypothetical protein
VARAQTVISTAPETEVAEDVVTDEITEVGQFFDLSGDLLILEPVVQGFNLEDYAYVSQSDGKEYISLSQMAQYLGLKYVRDNNNIFTRTYKVIEKIENNSLVYDSFRVKQYQGEEAIVDIKKDFGKNIEIGKNYEFTFGNGSKKLDDNIKSIFETCELISVIETDKVGLEQIQDKIN